MSNECGSNGEIIRTYLIDDYSIVTGCTIVVDEISSCSPSGITINNDVFVNGSLYSLIFSGGTFYGDGSNLSGISTDNFYVTGGTFNDISKTLTLFRNDGNSVLITGFTDYYVTGGTYSNGSLTLERQDSSFTISGFLTGTTDTYVTGFTYLNNNLIISQNEGQPDLVVNISLMTGLTIDGSFSATTYLGLPIDPDNYVTGGTYSNGTLTLDRQNGSVSISGFLSADTYVTGFTFNTGTYDLTILQNNGLPSLTQNLGILAGDITVTGGTYNPSNGVATFYNNAGGSFQVSGFLTGFTDIYLTSGSFNPNNGDLTLTRTDSVNVVVTGFTDYYVTGGTYSNGTLTLDRQNGSLTITGFTTTFTGNTSGDCISDLYVTNLNSCSPLHIQPINTGNVLIGENGGVNVGIGTSTPLYKLHISGETSNTELRYVDSTLFPRFNITTNNGDDLTFSQVVDSTSNSSLSLVFRGYSEASNNSYGKQGDGILYASTNVNGLNIINNQNAVRENYIRLYAGGNPSNKTSDIHIQGSGTTNGNVGINNNSPSAKLHIIGQDVSSSNYGLKVQNSGGTDNLVVRNDGNVGIGTPSPSETLDVSGKTKTINFQMTSGATNGYVLTSDNNGNAYWMSVTASTGYADTFVTGFTYSSNNLTILQNQGQLPLTVNILSMTGLTINGGLTATTITSTDLSGNGDRIVIASSVGTLSASSQSIIQTYIDPTGTVAGYLDNTSNWDINGIYTGTTITGTYQGQKHYNLNYFFEAVDDNLWIRLIRG